MCPCDFVFNLTRSYLYEGDLDSQADGCVSIALCSSGVPQSGGEGRGQEEREKNHRSALTTITISSLCGSNK